MKKIYDEFLICTVREADDLDRKFLKEYVDGVEAGGKRVYYPARDTNQVDETGGYKICCDNNLAMRQSEVISVYWTTKSQGTKFDLGMAFDHHRTENKRIKLTNRNNVEKIVEEQISRGMKKSFEMILLALDDMSKN